MQTDTANTWTDQQIYLQQWLALPKRERKPKTHGELADHLGVDITTLTRWKKLDGFADEVRKLIRDCLEDELSEIYGALKREAKGGSYQHIKLALELVGDYVQKIAPTTPDGTKPYVVSELSDEDLERIAATSSAGATKA